MNKEALLKIQEEVRKEFEDVFHKPLVQTWSGSPPTSAFDENNTFTSDNWNDARINLFRLWFYEGIHNEVVLLGEYEIIHTWYEDQNYVSIHNEETNDIYYVSWYKSRGRTDLFLHNGKPITLQRFAELISNMMKGELRGIEYD